MEERKIHHALFGVVLAAGVGLSATQADAAVYTFGPDVIDGGSVSATMDITVDGNKVIAVIDNTSAITLEDGFTNSGGDTDHAPGITGFGFNVDPDSLTLLDWTLKAQDKDDNTVVIGSSAGASDETWVMDTFTAGISLDYLPTTDKGVKGALYNPLAALSTALAATPNYFTTAELELVFSAPPEEPVDPFVRMQNIGVNGGGSSKQWGETDGGSTTDGGGSTTDGAGSTSDGNTNAAPEPVTALLSLVGIGALGCSTSRRR